MTPFFLVFSRFVHSLAACLSQICNYKQLASEVETLRATPYDADNLVHEQQLLQLWSLLQPGTVIKKREIILNIFKYPSIHFFMLLHGF